jgi:hypothetical protein
VLGGQRAENLAAHSKHRMQQRKAVRDAQVQSTPDLQAAQLGQIKEGCPGAALAGCSWFWEHGDQDPSGWCRRGRRVPQAPRAE